jgi:hypothetical protein
MKRLLYMPNIGSDHSLQHHNSDRQTDREEGGTRTGDESNEHHRIGWEEERRREERGRESCTWKVIGDSDNQMTAIMQTKLRNIF